MEQKKLRRSENRMLGGVIAGLAEYFDVDVTMLRVCFVLLSLFTAAFPGLLVYIILLLIMPNSQEQ
ncbi:MAG: PspC domain-containing protein [Paludibacteraceae bacterium]|jgi:phage shock protein C|nr:PspC domain-containing protein [Paludibacteraceae bacterium]